ncbi:hypothetical protein [Gordonia sp. (in: high G+C Gram-positive bacteria)]|uniref:hypothetical protein n=1 Tax=Gordonia sp. (in: high G+C Gram-positive bacteria) TaxID=84139 RepID=UPI003C711170
MTAPDVRAQLQKLRARGGTLVVVDPVRLYISTVADIDVQRLRCAYVLLGLLSVIAADGGPRARYVHPEVGRATRSQLQRAGRRHRTP